MRTTRFALLLIVLAASPSGLGWGQEKEAAKLDGTWKVMSGAFDGKDTDVKNRQLVFKGTEFTAYNGDKAGRTLQFTVDTGKKPAQIDLAQKGTDRKAAGIYELDGDTLRLCYGEPGKERPTKFESTAGQRHYYLVLKREKK